MCEWEAEVWIQHYWRTQRDEVSFSLLQDLHGYCGMIELTLAEAKEGKK